MKGLRNKINFWKFNGVYMLNSIATLKRYYKAN